MRKTPDSPGYKYVDYDENLNGRFIIVNKTDPEDFDVIEADHHFFITHLFNAFEDDDGLIHVDVLKYENADIYTKNSLVLNAIFEENDLSNEITRYSIDLENEQVNSEVLVEQEDGYVEFSNINPDKYGQKYRYVFWGQKFIKICSFPRVFSTIKSFKFSWISYKESKMWQNTSKSIQFS